MKKIIIPIDGSEFSDRAIEKGHEIAQACGSEVVLLHVVSGDFPNIYDASFSSTAGLEIEKFYQVAEEQGKSILEKGKEKFAQLAAGNSIEAILLSGAVDVATRIASAAEELEADLIVMGSEGAGGAMKGFLIGSVTNKVLHRTKIPVLVVK